MTNTNIKIIKTLNLKWMKMENIKIKTDSKY